MIRFRLTAKIYLIIAFIVTASVILGLITTHLLHNLSTSAMPEVGRLPFYARLLERLDPHDPVNAMKRLQEMLGPEAVPHFLLLDANGKVLYPSEQPSPLHWADIDKPQHPYEVRSTDSPAMWLPKPPPPLLIRLSGEPARYLAAVHRPLRRTPQFIYATMTSTLISIFVGIAIALIFLFRTLRQKVDLADSVLDRIQKGDLKARFPIRKLDEIGQAMLRFNRMADEIERLVDQIRSADKSRMKLLQELAHDLRTPVASLKNLLETLNSNTLEPNVRDELRGLALNEVEYFGRLIEDLLTLAQVTEPRFVAGQDQIELGEFVQDEADNRMGQNEAGRRLKVRQEIDSRPLTVTGDSHLLRRMLRNALDNALSYANQEIRLSVHLVDSREAEILIEDDGPGFSAEALASFGVRRISRVWDSGKSGRLSVGLGSVIMKNIALLHRGSVEAKNRQEAGQVKGALVCIRLPVQQVNRPD